MLLDQQLIRFKTAHTLDVGVTDNSTSDIVDAVVERLRPEVAAQLHASGQDKAIETTLKELRLHLIRGGVESGRFSNEFCVTWFDKSLVQGNFTPTLASLFLQVSSNFAGGATEIATKENSITLASKFYVRDLAINGKTMDFSVERWLLLTEAKEFFYMVEIAFSPQIQDSLAIWNDLW